MHLYGTKQSGALISFGASRHCYNTGGGVGWGWLFPSIVEKTEKGNGSQELLIPPPETDSLRNLGLSHNLSAALFCMHAAETSEEAECEQWGNYWLLRRNPPVKESERVLCARIDGLMRLSH